MNLYVDTKPELEWDKYDETAETEYGIYAVEANHIAEGYNTLLHIKGSIESIAPIVKGDTQIFDYEAIQKCRELAQADYDRRTAQRFKRVEMPEYAEIAKYENPSTRIVQEAYDQALIDLLQSAQKAMEGEG